MRTYRVFAVCVYVSVCERDRERKVHSTGAKVVRKKKCMESTRELRERERV